MVRPDQRTGNYFHLTGVSGAVDICQSKVMCPAAELKGNGKKQLHMTRDVGDARPQDEVAFQIRFDAPHHKSSDWDEWFKPPNDRFVANTPPPDMSLNDSSQSLRLET